MPTLLGQQNINNCHAPQTPKNRIDNFCKEFSWGSFISTQPEAKKDSSSIKENEFQTKCERFVFI